MRRAIRMLALAVLVNACSSTESNVTGPTSGSGSAQLSIWSDGPVTGGIFVSVDGASVGQLTQYFSDTPSCGQSGTLTVDVSPGNHTISGSASGGYTWSPYGVNVSSGSCMLFDLRAPVGGVSSGGTSACSNIIGNWKRNGDYNLYHTAGVVVSFNGSLGVVTYAPSGSWIPLGFTKWKNFNAATCSIDDANFSSSDGSFQEYLTYTVSVSGNTLTIGGTQYTRQ